MSLEQLVEARDAQSAQLQTLLAHRVNSILLVASLYDSFTLSEGQHLAELILGAYDNLSLTAQPHITRVSTRAQALERLAQRRFDLVITIGQVGDVPAPEFGRRVKAMYPDLPVFLIAYEMRELHALEGGPIAIPNIDRAFLWRGDVRLFLAIIKLVEDAMNVEHDTLVGGVRTLILIEDSVPFYSIYLPMLFTEMVKQTELLIAQSVNMGQRLLRRRLRPRVLMASTYEEGLALYDHFRDTVLAVISDVEFPREGALDPQAGLRLLRHIREIDEDTPLLLQSSRPYFAQDAEIYGAAFVDKNSRTLRSDFHEFMLEHLGFGDFVFQDEEGRIFARASDAGEMVSAVESVPASVLGYHASRNHFSNWLMARTEFELASAMRKLRIADFDSLEAMRDFLARSLRRIHRAARRGQIVDFDANRFRGLDQESGLLRIGGGSLGGKGRGLAFAYELLGRGDLAAGFDDLHIYVPPAAVLGTDVFDRFLEDNDLLPFALGLEDDQEILEQFQRTELPPDIMDDLRVLAEHVDFPVAVRSSSLLEDSHHLPAAGIYPTHMLPNIDPDPAERLRQLVRAVKHVYAATFFEGAKSYFEASPNRVEDEKMAVIIQQVFGLRHGDHLYPHLSGVAESHNFYPLREMRAEEGVAIVALGLGKTVVDGGRAVRFSPEHPQWLPQFSSPEDILENAQRSFWAVDLTREPDLDDPDPPSGTVELGLDVAERHGTLWPVASVYEPENETVYDGLSRVGVRLVTMAPILKHRAFPLSAVIKRLLQLGQLGLAGPVEIEFAANLRSRKEGPSEVAFLQIRPMVISDPVQPFDVTRFKEDQTFVRTSNALGVGRRSDIRDLVVVCKVNFKRDNTPAVAAEVGRINHRLQIEGRPYVLVGPGRWGTADRHLGIPVQWGQIAGAAAIVECSMGGQVIEPSQGTHFFHNMTSLGIGYFTACHGQSDMIDWDWLETLEETTEPDALVRHYRLPEPVEVLIDGEHNRGVVLKRRAKAEAAE